MIMATKKLFVPACGQRKELAIKQGQYTKKRVRDQEEKATKYDGHYKRCVSKMGIDRLRNFFRLGLISSLSSVSFFYSSRFRVGPGQFIVFKMNMFEVAE
jgi:hypothetical protein